MVLWPSTLLFPVVLTAPINPLSAPYSALKFRQTKLATSWWPQWRIKRLKSWQISPKRSWDESERMSDKQKHDCKRTFISLIESRLSWQSLIASSLLWYQIWWMFFPSALTTGFFLMFDAKSELATLRVQRADVKPSDTYQITNDLCIYWIHFLMSVFCYIWQAIK